MLIFVIYAQTIFQDSFKDAELVGKINQLHYLIRLLLPLLEEMNREQGIELEVEAKIKGIHDEYIIDASMYNN